MSLYDELEKEDDKATEDSLYNFLESEDKVQISNGQKKDKDIKSSALRFQPRSRLGNKQNKSKVKNEPAVLKVASIDHNAKKDSDEHLVSEFKKEEEDSSKTQPLIYFSNSVIHEKLRPREYSIWREDYDPLRPNKYEEYINSEERIAEDEDWLEYLQNIKNAKEIEESVRYGLDYEDDEEQKDDIDEEDITEVDEEEEEDSQEEETVKTTSSTGSFALNLLKRYGWIPGKGLGKTSNGIIKPLKVITNKRKPGSGKIVVDKSKNKKKRKP